MCFLFFNKTARDELSSLKNNTRNLMDEMTVRPYLSPSFHACALFSSARYLINSLSELLSLAVTLLTAPLLLFTPWNIPSLPWIVLEQAANCMVSAITAVVQPCFFLLRTISSLIMGYRENTPPPYYNAHNYEAPEPYYMSH